jgi:hypothetical protein
MKELVRLPWDVRWMNSMGSSRCTLVNRVETRGRLSSAVCTLIRASGGGDVQLRRLDWLLATDVPTP